MQSVAKHMVRQGYRKIANMSSISCLGGAPKGELAYSAAKAAVINLTAVSAIDLGPYGINVNCVAPGFITTDFHIKLAGSMEKLNEIREKKSRLTDQLRTGESKNPARVALFLASDDSSFITEQVIVTDGGRQDFINHS